MNLNFPKKWAQLIKLIIFSLKKMHKRFNLKCKDLL